LHEGRLVQRRVDVVIVRLHVMVVIGVKVLSYVIACPVCLATGASVVLQLCQGGSSRGGGYERATTVFIGRALLCLHAVEDSSRIAVAGGIVSSIMLAEDVPVALSQR
jgi:hypothetical protein